MFGLLLAVFLYFKHVVKDPAVGSETLLGNMRRGIETHAEMTSYLTLLLATLGIMIGLFTVTGFINRMGAMLLDLGAWNIIAMIVMAYHLRLAGRRRAAADRDLHHRRGHHRAAVAELGINPWVAHFFVFLLSVWGELSPPTSLDRRRFRAHRERLLHAHDVGGVEDLHADHADDLCDLHALRHGDDPRLEADRRLHPRDDRNLRRCLRHVRAVRRKSRPATFMLTRFASLGLFALVMFLHPDDNGRAQSLSPRSGLPFTDCLAVAPRCLWPAA